MGEQIEARLTHGSIAVLGEVMRHMANNPDLWQIFFGETGGTDEGEVGPRGADPPAPRAGRGEDRRIIDLEAGGGPRHGRGGTHGGDLRRGGERSRRDERGDHPYRLEPYGRGIVGAP